MQDGVWIILSGSCKFPFALADRICFPICHCEAPTGPWRPEREARGSALGVQFRSTWPDNRKVSGEYGTVTRRGVEDAATYKVCAVGDGLHEPQVPSRDCHVALLLAMTHQGACAGNGARHRFGCPYAASRTGLAVPAPTTHGRRPCEIFHIPLSLLLEVSPCSVVSSWRRGNPNVFPREFFPALCALEGDRGGSAVIRQYPERYLAVDVPPEALADVDTPEALRAIRDHL